MLKFSAANAKIEALKLVPSLEGFFTGKRKVFSFDLLSGYSCPYAEACLSKAVVDKITGKRSIKDGPKTEFRCFSASQEVQYTNVYNLRKGNFDAMRQAPNKLEALNAAMPPKLGICRIHVAGDFFSQDYFDAWMMMAATHPECLFYAYTKSLKFWLARRNQLPTNFVLTASYGGRDDALIESEGLRFAKVVFSEAEAAEAGLPIDHDDSHAADPTTANQSFALMLHGTQPKGSEAGEALKVLKRDKVQHSYSRKAGVK